MPSNWYRFTRHRAIGENYLLADLYQVAVGEHLYGGTD